MVTRRRDACSIRTRQCWIYLSVLLLIGLTARLVRASGLDIVWKRSSPAPTTRGAVVAFSPDGRIIAAGTPVSGNSAIQLYRARSRYRPGTAFTPWLPAIARNLALGELRHRGVVKRAEQRLAEEAGASGGEWTVERYEAGERVRAALACLPEDQRAAVVLKEYQQLEYREIGQVLGCSEAAARARTYRARVSLRALLRDWWETR